MSSTTRVGCGAGFAGDRISPAVDLCRYGNLDYLVLECLAERTIALGQQRRHRDPALGYDPLLVERLTPLLPVLAETNTKLVTNMGAANPLAAGRRVAGLSAELGLALRVFVVTGDDVLDRVDLRAPALEDQVPLEEHGQVLAANAYLGAEAVLPALESGADVVITGRVADPSLVLACLAHRDATFLTDHRKAAAGTLAGHLLECGGQLTGGYYADPGYKRVPHLELLGMPYCDVGSDGTILVSKLPTTGGAVTSGVVTEQLLYEITDPFAYLTPDVTLDISEVEIEEVGHDQVRVTGASGIAAPETLKVSVAYLAGYRGEAEISYFGLGAKDRAEWAARIVKHHLDPELDPVSFNIIHGDSSSSRLESQTGLTEARLTVTGLGARTQYAQRLGRAVEALYTNGPAGGGGVRRRTEEVVGVVSTLVPRVHVTPRVLEVWP